MALGAVVAVLLCLASGEAAAQSTCVLLPHASAEVPAATWQEVDRAVAEALRARGVIVLAARDAQLRMMGQPMEDCGAIECAPDVNRFLGTAFAVLTEVTWLRGRPTAVNVVLIGVSSDHAAGGQASAARGELEEATATAFGIAWDRWEADRQGQLLVESTPAGAFVELDGTSVGRAPVRRLVTTGVHTVRLALEGYVSETREITIDRHEERTLSIALVPTEPTAAADAASGEGPSGGAASTRVGTTVEQPHWGNWLLGGGLLAAAVGLAIEPIYAASIAGQRTPTGEFYAFGAQEGILTGLSAACLIGGIVVLAVQPFRETITVEPGLGSLRIRGAF